jgi:PIN domain nuclease of toxin-antitoxin system
VLEKSGGIFEVAPVDMGVATAVESVPRDCISDPFDRMIGATAVALGLPLVTADRKLRRLSALKTLW